MPDEGTAPPSWTPFSMTSKRSLVQVILHEKVARNGAIPSNPMHSKLTPHRRWGDAS